MSRSATAKVAISLDASLLTRTERLRKATGETRSALIGRALRGLLRDAARAKDIAEYIEAYRRKPETAQDERAARAIARRSFRSLPWKES